MPLPMAACDHTGRVRAYLRDSPVHDTNYQAEQSKIEIDPLSGEEVAELVKSVNATPADVVARVRAAMERR